MVEESLRMVVLSPSTSDSRKKFKRGQVIAGRVETEEIVSVFPLFKSERELSIGKRG